MHIENPAPRYPYRSITVVPGLLCVLLCHFTIEILYLTKLWRPLQFYQFVSKPALRSVVKDCLLYPKNSPFFCAREEHPVQGSSPDQQELHLLCAPLEVSSIFSPHLSLSCHYQNTEQSFTPMQASLGYF